MKIACLLPLLLLTFQPMASWGGGDNWLFRVVDVKAELEDCTRIRLESTESGQRFPSSCKSFEVLSCYRWSWWNTNKPVTRDERIRGYAYLVPFVETETEVFLKTIIPSRKATREYLDEDN